MGGWKRIGKQTNVSWKGDRGEVCIAISVDGADAIADVKRRLPDPEQWACYSRPESTDWFVEEPHELRGGVDEAIEQIKQRSERRRAALRAYLDIERREQEYTVEFSDRRERRFSLDEILSPEELRQPLSQQVANIF